MDKDRFEIFYIRHAMPESGLCDGRDSCDIRLGDYGNSQAALLGERFRDMEFDAVFSSPLVRCLGTAAGALSKMKNPPAVEVLPEIIEVGTTPGYLGSSKPEMERFCPNIVPCADRVIEGEILCATDEQNDARAKAVLAYLKERFTFGQRVALFSHGSFGNHFIWAVIGAEPVDGMVYSINHASVTKIKITDDGKTRISFMNDVSHLRSLQPDFDITV